MQRQMLSILWDFGVGFAEIDTDKSNPITDTKRAYKVKRGHLAWPADVRARFVKNAPYRLVKAYMVALYTGQRRGDLVAMRRSAVDLVGTKKRRPWIDIIQEKTGEPLRMTIHRDLLAFLRGENDQTSEFLIVNFLGTPYTQASLTHAVKEQLIANGDSKYSLHGLRKNAGIALAEAGASVPQIMAVLGHKTPTMAIYYVQQANKAKLNESAIELWENA